jgi:hypothetical protein
VLGEIALATSPPAIDKAEASLRHALAIAEELSMRPLLGLCYLGLGRVAEHTGNRARAEEYVRTALALFRAMDLGVWLVRAEAALARVLEQPMVAKSDGIARILFVVSRDELPLYNQLTREFVGKDNIRVVLDRRTGERRTSDATPGAERRRGDRRVRTLTDSQLRALGWSIVRFEGE